MMMRALYLALALVSAAADLRMACQPKWNGQGHGNWYVRDANHRVPFVPDYSAYMEPSDFGYEKLKTQRDGGGYDNFLRSNIDNEQDKRNFETEPGRDHLPFRSYETAATDEHESVKHKLPANPLPSYPQCPQAGGTWKNNAGNHGQADVCLNPGETQRRGEQSNTRNWDCPIGCELTKIGTKGRSYQPYCYLTGTTDHCDLGRTGGAITATPGKPVIVPLRWNNPHSSELEVNVWIRSQKELRYVVPIKKPTCAGEGHQDAVFVFTVPSDFNSLGSKIPGFAGCKAIGDCVLQIYAHSVESRQYAMGTPLIVTGTVPIRTVGGTIAAAGVDVGLNLDALSRKTCLSSADASADIGKAVPRMARLISDQFNHAFQNSDFSPYSGQQPESISRNLQAACILKMVTGNRGELGRHKMHQDNHTVSHFQHKIEKKAKELVRVYESIANQIISAIGKDMANTDASMPSKSNSTQQVDTCFRCAEVGSVTTRRQTTNTYVPSFRIPKALVETARLYIAPIFGGEMCGAKKQNPQKFIEVQANGDALLLIYEAVLDDMNTQFTAAGHMGLGYMGPALKTEFSTKSHATQYLKKDAAEKKDRGYYAATEAGLCWPYVRSKASPCASTVITQEFVQSVDGDGNVPKVAPEDPILPGPAPDPELPGPGGRRLSAANSIRSLIDASNDDDDASLISAENSDMNGVGRDSTCANDAMASEMDNATYTCHIPGDTTPAAWQLFADIGQVWPAGMEEVEEELPFIGGFFFGLFVGAALAAAAVGLFHFVGVLAVRKQLEESPQPVWVKAVGAFLLVAIGVALLALGSTLTSVVGFWTGVLAGTVVVCIGARELSWRNWQQSRELLPSKEGAKDYKYMPPPRGPA